jgi:hypothetical protein
MQLLRQTIEVRRERHGCVLAATAADEPSAFQVCAEREAGVIKRSQEFVLFPVRTGTPFLAG